MTCCISISIIHHWIFPWLYYFMDFSLTSLHLKKKHLFRYKKWSHSFRNKSTGNWSVFCSSMQLSAVLCRTSFGNQWSLWLLPGPLELTPLRKVSTPSSNPILCTLCLVLLHDASHLIGVCVLIIVHYHVYVIRSSIELSLIANLDIRMIIKPSTIFRHFPFVSKIRHFPFMSETYKEVTFHRSRCEDPTIFLKGRRLWILLMSSCYLLTSIVDLVLWSVCQMDH